MFMLPTRVRGVQLVLTYGRWVLLFVCFAAVFASGLSHDQAAFVTTGIIGVLTCVGGLFIDVFRNQEVRALREEIAIHRRTEAHRRNLNQRGRS